MTEAEGVGWRGHWPELLALFCAPVLLLALNPVWLANKFDDTDTWLYYGHFLRFFDGVAPGGNVPIDYYRTRLPYILPGAVLYRVFSDAAARLAFMAMVYGAIVVPFWYVARAQASRAIAFATTALLVCDIYFVRLVGWQYVDNGVLAYQALTFAFVTAAARSATPRRFYFLAGFSAASMVFTHLGAACLLPVFVAYACVLPRRRFPDVPLARRLREPFRYVLLGGLVCQGAYGLLNIWANGGDFVFIFEQLFIAVNEAITMSAAQPIPFLAASGYWLVAHGVALVGSVIGLLAWRWRGTRDGRMFWLASAAVMLSFITLLEVLHLTYFLSRDGEYVSFFLILTYLALGALMFQPGVVGWRLAVVAVAVMGGSIGARLWFLGVLPVGAVPVVWLAVLGGVAVAVSLVFRGAVAFLCALAVFATVTVLTPLPFKRDDSIIPMARLIRMVAGERIPRIFLDAGDPIGLATLRSIVGVFTERGWGRHGEYYPDFSRNTWKPYYNFASGEVVVVLGSTVTDAESARRALAGYVGSAALLASFRVERPDVPLWAHMFEITMPPAR